MRPLLGTTPSPPAAGGFSAFAAASAAGSCGGPGLALATAANAATGRPLSRSACARSVARVVRLAIVHEASRTTAPAFNLVRNIVLRTPSVSEVTDQGTTPPVVYRNAAWTVAFARAARTAAANR